MGDHIRAIHATLWLLGLSVHSELLYQVAQHLMPCTFLVGLYSESMYCLQ